MAAGEHTRDNATPPFDEAELRRRAEESFDALAADADPSATTPQEVAAILHELRVHQIELEMQNEELRRTHDELDEQCEKYYDLFDLAPVGYLTVDGEGTITEANLTGAHLLGVERHELVGRPLVSFFAESDRDVFYLHARAIENTHKPQTYEARLLRAGGSGGADSGKGRFWALLEVSPQHAVGGEDPSTWVAFTDVTGRKEAEEELRASEERYRAIATNTPDHILIQDAELRYTYVVNPQLGLTEEEMLGKTDADFLDAAGAAKLTAIKRRVLESGEPFAFEDSLENSKGKTEYFDGSYVPTFDEAGRPGGIVGYFRNVTKRRAAEERLRASEERFRVLAALAPVGIYLTDPHGNCTYANPAWCAMAGRSAEEALGQGWVRGLHPDDREKVFANWQQMVESHGQWGHEYRFQTPDNKVTWVYGSAAEQRDESGETVQYVGVNLDITARKAAEDALAVAKDRLQAVFELLPAGVSVIDSNGVVVVANPALERILHTTAEGLARGDYRNRTYLRGDGTPMPPEEFATALAQRAGRAVHNVETGVVLEDGSTTWVSVSAIPTDSAGWRMIVVTVDVTERKRVELALRESDARYERLFNNMLEGFAYCRMIYDEEGRPADWLYLDTNPAFSRITGLTGVGGKRVLEIFPTIMDDNPELIELYDKVVATGEADDFVLFVKPLDMWLRVSAVRPEPGHFVAVFEDVSERRRAELALLDSEANLKKAQHYARVGSWTWDLKTGHLEWSDEMFELFGIDRETFSGSLEDVVARAIHPDDRAAVEQANLSVLENGEPMPLEYRIICPDGSTRTVWAEAGEMLLDEADTPSVLVGTVQDITERKRIEAWRDMDHAILGILSAPQSSNSPLEDVAAALKEGTGFGAIGIRLQDGEDCPYVAGAGFPDGFLTSENSLLEFDELGNPVRDENGNARLAGTCGLVITGEPVSDDSILTPYGTFWTNDSLPLLDLPRGRDPRLRPRNQCLAYGFSTMALVPIRVAANTVGLIHLCDQRKGRLNDALVERLEVVASHIGEALMRKQAEHSLLESEARLRVAVDDLRDAFTSSIELLGRMVETRDPYTAGHERRVSELGVAIATQMGMPPEKIEEIRITGLVHDIGKISVPAEILSKPGTLTDMEFELIKGHAEAGFDILSSANFADAIAEIVFQHHERDDGSGYPRGLSGDEILNAAKVIIVADVVEAMSSHRPYRAALGIDVALAEIERGAGQQYDAAAAEACASVFAAGFEFSRIDFSSADYHQAATAGGDSDSDSEPRSAE